MGRKIKYIIVFTFMIIIYSRASAYAFINYNIDGINTAYDYPSISIYINGIKESPPMDPLMIEGSVLVPIRFISEQFGSKIGYDSSKVWIDYNSSKIILYYHKNIAYINNTPVQLDVSVKLINNGYTYVPLRFIAQAFNNDVRWDGAAKTVYIGSKTGNTDSQSKDLKPSYTVDSIGYSSINDVKNVIILTQDTDYKVSKSQTGDVIYIDIKGAALKNNLYGFMIGDSIVKNISPMQITSDTVRVAIDLNSDADYSVSQQDGKLTINLKPVANLNLPSSLMVNASTANIRSGPGTEYSILTKVNNGNILSVNKKSGDWYEVKTPDGTIGWIAGWLTISYDNININSRTDVAYGNTPSRGFIGQANAGAPYTGKGVWYSIYSKMPDANDLSRFASAGVTHIYLEVATSQAGFQDKWKNWLDALLPAAHRAGIKVIGWIYTDLKDTSFDASLTDEVAAYTAPGGYRIDAVAADIEELPSKDQVQSSKIIEDYATKSLKGLPSGMPFIAITYPPQYRPNYPFAAMAKYFNAIALMDYWHVSDANYTSDDAKQFVADSINKVRYIAGDSVNIEVILQGYDDGYGLPTKDELSGALGASSSAAGYSIYTWNTLSDELKNIFANY